MKRAKYKQISSFPKSEFDVGDEIFASGDGHLAVVVINDNHRYDLRNYPKLFQFMGYYDVKQDGEMP